MDLVKYVYVTLVRGVSFLAYSPGQKRAGRRDGRIAKHRYARNLSVRQSVSLTKVTGTRARHGHLTFFFLLFLRHDIMRINAFSHLLDMMRHNNSSMYEAN